MTEYNFNFKNSIFTKQAIKAAREKAIKKEVQDSTASSNEVKNLLEQKCDNAEVFRDLTDEEVEARINAEDQSPLKLIKNLINNKHKDSSGVNYVTNQRNNLNGIEKDSSGVNFVTNQRNDLSEKDSSGVLPPQNDAFRHTEQSEVSQSIQGDGEILRHFVPQNDSLPTAGAIEDSETVLIPNDGDSGVSQQLVTEFTPESVDSGISQQLVTSFTPTPNPTPVENRANATSSLTIKDADGAKPQTLAAGDKLNVTYVYEEKTYNYTIEAKSAQNVTLQTKDGYFTVVGDNLAVQTGDEQYSFVALIGTTNSIKIGTNGKTYNGNSIAYNSDEGGHSIYTWGDTPESTADYKMSRGETKTITVTQEEQILELINPFDDKKHYYTLKMRDDITPASNSAVDFTQQSVKFQFLANGRLVVTGSYVDIEAFDGQKDDFIILGHFNKITTGDENDIVRVGYVMDDNGNYKLTSACTTYEDGSQGNYYYSDSTKGAGRGTTADDGTFTPTYYAAVGNQIFTGDGDDHVTMLMNKKDVRFRIDMGEGYDSLANMSALGITYTTQQAGFIKNTELAPISFGKIESTDNNGNSLLDGDDGWARQGSSSDCTFLSFINTLCQVDDKIDTITQKRKLNDFVDIVDDGTNYTVTFKNYVPAEGKVKSITFAKTDFDSFTGSRGDIDTVIVHYAFGKILAKNKDYDRFYGRNISNVHDAQYSIFTKYFMGNDYFIQYNNYGLHNETEEVPISRADFKAKLLDSWNNYTNTTNESEKILTLLIGLQGANDYKIGKATSHSYAVKNISTDLNGNYYIELINPWDDRDCVRFDLDYIVNNWNLTMNIYGIESENVVV